MGKLIANRTRKAVPKPENILEELNKIVEKWIKVSSKEINLLERVVGVLEKVIPELYKFEIIVSIIVGVWAGGKIYAFLRFVSPYFTEYINYGKYLFEQSSNKTKLNLLFVIPITALVSVIFYKVIPRIFRYLSKK